MTGNLYTSDYHMGILKKYIDQNRFAKSKTRNVLELIQPSANDVILEIGCSSGASSFICANKGAFVLGVDNDATAITVAKNMSNVMLKKDGKCEFMVGPAEEFMDVYNFNKVIMIDLTEHVDDKTFIEILKGISSTLSGVHLFIYTPNKAHIFEILKRHNIILKNDPTHIALRNMEEANTILEDQGYSIIRSYNRPSHIYLFSLLETFLSQFPTIGKHFKRRLCIEAIAK